MLFKIKLNFFKDMNDYIILGISVTYNILIVKIFFKDIFR